MTVTALPTPARLLAGLPLDTPVGTHRAAIKAVLSGADDRLLVIAGPCSIHDPVAGLEYAQRLAHMAGALSDRLLIVMRAYLEKPRTVTGWRGLVPDPHLDGTGDLAHGLVTGRRFLLGAAAAGLPLAYEFVDPMLAPYLSDVVSWGCVGARTVTSQPHRQLASWLPMPVGFKNGVDGDVRVAVEAVRAAAVPQAMPGMGFDGEPVVVHGPGNVDGHVVLRGGSHGPNHDPASVRAALALLAESSLPQRIVIDASHGNSGKDHRRQLHVIAGLAERVAAGEPGITGVMIESFLHEGRQELGTSLRHGVSVTDACLGWHTTVELLEQLAAAIGARRG